MKKSVFLVLFVFTMFVTSSCEKTDVNDEIEFDLNATDKPSTGSPGSGSGDDVY